MEQKLKTKVIGVDVSKSTLDCYFLHNDQFKQYNNTKKGIESLIRYCRSESIELIVCESTAHYHKQLEILMLEDKLPLAVANPRHTRRYAQALGYLAKTDKLDAKVLALFGQATNPPIRELSRIEVRNLRVYVNRRNQLINVKTSETLRKSSITEDFVIDEISEHIEQIEKQIKIYDKKIMDLINSDEEFTKIFKIIISVPGASVVTASTLIAYLPELGKRKRNQIAALVGVAPYNNDSGTKSGKRTCFGGRKEVRNILYLGMLSAVRCNDYIKPIYQRLRQNGKPSKVAMNACARKMIIMINTLVKKETLWMNAEERAENLV